MRNCEMSRVRERGVYEQLNNRNEGELVSNKRETVKKRKGGSDSKTQRKGHSYPPPGTCQHLRVFLGDSPKRCMELHSLQISNRTCCTLMRTVCSPVTSERGSLYLFLYCLLRKTFERKKDLVTAMDTRLETRRRWRVCPLTAGGTADLPPLVHPS